MQRKLLKLGNLPKSGAFVFRDLAAKVEVTQLGTNHALKCDLQLRWQPWQGLQLICHGIGDGLKPFEKHGTKARIEGKITDGPFAGWNIVAPEMFSLRSHFHWIRGESTQRQVWFRQEPQTYVELIAPAIEEPAEDDVLCYWIPSFFFHGTEETSKLRKRRCFAGFRFNVSGNEFTFRQVPDHKEIEELFRDREIACAITAVAEARGTIVRDPKLDGESIGCLFSLMSALWGFWMHPLACARYGNNGGLKRLTFLPRTGRPYHSHRSFLNVLERNGKLVNCWPQYLETVLPNFITKSNDLKLRSVCRQLVEAQYELVVESRVSLLLMCLEQICTRYLAAKGVNMPDAPPEDKVNRCNKDLHCLSKLFRKQLPTYRDSLRNALFHEGATKETDMMKLYGISLDMINACVLLLSAICGYQAELKLQDLQRGEKIVSVDAVGNL